MMTAVPIRLVVESIRPPRPEQELREPTRGNERHGESVVDRSKVAMLQSG